MAPVLPAGNHLNLPLSHQVPKTDIAEELMDLIAEIRPQVVGQAFFAILAITLVAATGGIQGFTDRIDDFRDKDGVCLTGQAITTAGPPDTGHQLVTAKAGTTARDTRGKSPAGQICQPDSPAPDPHEGRDPALPSPHSGLWWSVS